MLIVWAVVVNALAQGVLRWVTQWRPWTEHQPSNWEADTLPLS